MKRPTYTHTVSDNIAGHSYIQRDRERETGMKRHTYTRTVNDNIDIYRLSQKEKH